MHRWEFRAGLILMGWGPVEAALEFGTSPGTIMELERGDPNAVLEGPLIERAREVFKVRRLAIRPVEG